MSRLTKLLFFILFSINALGSCTLSSLQSVNWKDVSETTQVCIIVCIITNWTGVLLAFFFNPSPRPTSIPGPVVPVAGPVLTATQPKTP